MNQYKPTQQLYHLRITIDLGLPPMAWQALDAKRRSEAAEEQRKKKQQAFGRGGAGVGRFFGGPKIEDLTGKIFQNMAKWWTKTGQIGRFRPKFGFKHQRCGISQWNVGVKRLKLYFFV